MIADIPGDINVCSFFPSLGNKLAAAAPADSHSFYQARRLAGQFHVRGSKNPLNFSCHLIKRPRLGPLPHPTDSQPDTPIF